MKSLFLVALLGFSLSPALGAREIYRFEAPGSSITFTVHQFLGTTTGRFKQCSGTIEIDREHPERSAVNARIQVGSIDTKIQKRDNHLLSPEFFDARRYPEMVFRSKTVTPTGKQAGDITGELTMHGVTRNVLLHVRLLTPLSGADSPPRTRWMITTEPLKRRDFNLAFTRTAEAVSGIGQDVAVKMEIEAAKARSE